MNGSPRVLPLIGGIVAMVGALVSLAALFPDYYDDGFARRLEPGPRWFVVFFVSGVVAAGLMLLAQRGTQLAGTGLLVTLCATFVGARALEITRVTDDRFRAGVGAGVVVDVAGFALVAAGAALAVLGLLVEGVERPVLRPVGPAVAWLAVLGAFAGFVTAYGYGLNYVDLGVGGGFAQGSPLVPSARSLWAQMVVILALVAGPVVVAVGRRALAAGVAAGLLVFTAASVLSRFLEAGTVRGIDRRLDPVEGTWVMLVGGLLLGAFALVRLATPDGADPAPGERPAGP
ncbi:MAG TPA: hypothetical protein VMQ81_06815 [Acidimicrobiia bacterium]|nr:hypothetical protein [Acidimicrobiia bacterium]